MAFVFDIGERFAFVSGIRFDAFQEERRWRGTSLRDHKDGCSGANGLLLIAAEETFDVSNPNHMAAAQSIADALEPLNKPRRRA